MKVLRCFWLGCLLISACTKNDGKFSISPVTNCLLKTATYTTVPATYQATDEYSYDSYNRVTELNSTRLQLDFKYTYNNNNNVLGVSIYDLSNNGRLVGTELFSYFGSTVTVHTFDSSGAEYNTITITLNGQQQVTNIAANGDNESISYDGNGNVTGFMLCCSPSQTNTFAYDQKKHPLSMIGGKNYHLMLFTGADPQSFINNVVTDAAVPGATTYTYNNDGFPLSSTVPSTAVKGQRYTVTYNYIYN
jgi:hypothetical protein